LISSSLYNCVKFEKVEGIESDTQTIYLQEWRKEKQWSFEPKEST